MVDDGRGVRAAAGADDLRVMYVCISFRFVQPFQHGRSGIAEDRAGVRGIVREAGVGV